MKYFCLSLMAVLVMASVSYADYCVEVGATTAGTAFFTISDPIDLDDPNDVLVAFDVRVTNLKSFYDVVLTGGIHQTNYNVGYALATPFAASGGADPIYDSHFLFEESSILKTPGFGAFADTNDWSNPGGLSLAGPMAGIGDMTSSPQGEGFSFADFADDLLFMRVVHLKTVPFLSLQMTSPMMGVDVRYEVFLEPEPAVLVMIVLGGLCLAGHRPRKWRQKG